MMDRFDRVLVAVLLIVIGLFAFVVGGCTSGEDAEIDSNEPTHPKLWSMLDDSFIQGASANSSLFAGHSELLEKNLWWQEHTFDPQQEPRHSLLAYFPVGNGLSFAFLGTTNPLHTLHELSGPTYQFGDDRFFPNVSLRVLDTNANKDISFTHQAIWRTRKSSVVCTAETTSDDNLSLFSYTLAPMPATPMLIQAIEVANTGSSEVALRLYTDMVVSAESHEDSMIFVRDERTMAFEPMDKSGWNRGKEDFMRKSGWFSDEFTLQPGKSKVVYFVFRFSRNPDIQLPALPASESDIESMLDETLQYWKDWFDAGPELDTPDARVNDLFLSLQYTVKVQQSFQGALVPMSHYSYTWIRDTFAPARFFFRIGRTKDALDMIEYYHHAAAANDNIGNALRCDEDVSQEIQEPDWLSKEEFTGRKRGEAPSYIPLMYAEYLAAGGDRNLVVERLPYLLHTLLRQPITEDGFMYFSGDETYRPAMGTNLGLSADYKFEDNCYSANSSFLYVAASKFLIGFLESLDSNVSLPFDRDEMLSELKSRSGLVWQTLQDRYFLQDEGHYSPFVFIEDMKFETTPVPDVNNKPVWLGLLDATDEYAISNARRMYEKIGKEDGLVQNASGDPLEIMGYKTGNGIYTGMSAGYWLYNVKALGMDEVAEKVFNTLAKLVSASGNVPEDGVYGSFEPLQLSYSENSIGEIWARCRPWEGAITAEALFFYLTGATREETGSWRFSPSFPNDWGVWCVKRFPPSEEKTCFEP